MAISGLLLDWYKKEGRELPWRETRNPYNIWVSEIIFQQTRIAQGTAYYLRFMDEFPDVCNLANAESSRLMKVWQGLGYYSRAVNMHETAKRICFEMKGEFPNDYETIRSLKGVGDYTAGAIASISFGIAIPAIDGNVKRVFSRLKGIEEELGSRTVELKIRQAVEEEMDHAMPGNFNQALMDLGSLICKPKNPDCPNCPVISNCIARMKGLENSLPVKTKKTKQKSRYFHYFIFTDGKEVILQQRTSKDIWQYLYEFLLIESTGKLKPQEAIEQARSKFKLPGNTGNWKISKVIRHILSHQKLHTVFYHCQLDRLDFSSVEKTRRVPLESLQDYALPRLIDRFLEENNANSEWF